MATPALALAQNKQELEFKEAPEVEAIAKKLIRQLSIFSVGVE